MGQHPASVGFGRYLREVIHAAGYATPTQFARRVGTDPSVVLRWISEEQRPTIRSIERIAPVLGRTIHEMVNAAYPESLPLANLAVSSPDPSNLGPSNKDTARDATPARTSKAARPPVPATGTGSPHRLAVEVDQLLASDSPLAPADRDRLETTIDRELGRYRRYLIERRTA